MRRNSVTLDRTGGRDSVVAVAARMQRFSSALAGLVLPVQSDSAQVVVVWDRIGGWFSDGKIKRTWFAPSIDG
jgi:hypothetical protein